MKNLAIYMRISQEDDNDAESESIQNQRDLLHNFIASKAEFANYNVVEVIDDGISGTTLNRKGLQELLQRAGKDVFVIIVKDFSRFARNLIEVGNYLDSVFPFLGVRFISVNDGYDSAENMGKTIGLDMSLKAMVYDMYSKDLSTKVYTGMRTLMLKGQHLGRTAVYGYRKDENDRKRLVVDEMAAQVVRRIYKMKLDGKTHSEIAIILNEEGVLCPLLYREKYIPSERVYGIKTGNNMKWTSYQINKILNDERYIGTYIAGKYKRENISSNKRVLLPKEEWIRIENMYEPVVSHEDFEMVSRLMITKTGAEKRNKTITSLFVSKLTCEHCNRNLTKVHTKNAYYYCGTKKFDPTTPCENIKLFETDLEQVVLAALNIQIGLLESNKSVLGGKKQEESIEQSMTDCEKELKALSKKSIYLFEQFADEKISIEDYKAKKSINDQAIQNTKKHLQNLQSELQMLMTQNENSNSLSKYKFVDKLTREMVLELVREIKVYEDNRIEIVWNFKEN